MAGWSWRVQSPAFRRSSRQAKAWTLYRRAQWNPASARIGVKLSPKSSGALNMECASRACAFSPASVACGKQSGSMAAAIQNRHASGFSLYLLEITHCKSKCYDLWFLLRLTPMRGPRDCLERDCTVYRLAPKTSARGFSAAQCLPLTREHYITFPRQCTSKRLSPSWGAWSRCSRSTLCSRSLWRHSCSPFMPI